MLPHKFDIPDSMKLSIFCKETCMSKIPPRNTLGVKYNFQPKHQNLKKEAINTQTKGPTRPNSTIHTNCTDRILI